MKGTSMEFYPTLLTLHIIFAGGWIISFISDIYLKSNITKNKGLSCEKNLISLYLKLSNLTGIIGATGILITGIILVLKSCLHIFSNDFKSLAYNKTNSDGNPAFNNFSLCNSFCKKIKNCYWRKS